MRATHLFVRPVRGWSVSSDRAIGFADYELIQSDTFFLTSEVVECVEHN